MAVIAALSVGLCLHWPSLDGGFRSDDFVQRAMLRGTFPSPRSSFDLFDFASGTRADFEKLVDFGYLPWWAQPDLRLSMWRPLASASIALDLHCFGNNARAHHAHSLAWFALLLLSAAGVLFELLPSPTAALALLLYAVSPCHTFPVGWLANRSTLMATSLGFLALYALLRANRAGVNARNTGWLLAGGLASLAVSSGEYALAALVYALLWLWRIPQPPAAKHAQACLPVALPVLGYLLLRSAVGADSIGSGYYLSPIHDTWAYIQALFSRVPVLVADVVLGLPSLYLHKGLPWRGWILSLELFTPELWLQLPDWRSWHILLGYASFAAGSCMLWQLLRRPDARYQQLPWLLLAAALGLVPCAGSVPEDRLLTAAALGGSALLASYLIEAFPLRKRSQTRGQRALQLGLWTLAALAAISGLTRSYAGARRLPESARIMDAWAQSAELPRSHADETRVYLLNVADFNSAANLPFMRLERGHPLPRSYRRLSPGPQPIDITRSADNVLDVSVLTDAVYGSALPSLYRTAERPMVPGDIVKLPELEVRVLRVRDGNPSALRFTFDRSLDDPSLWFLEASSDGLRRARLPAMGETRRLMHAQVRDVRRTQR